MNYQWSSGLWVAITVALGRPLVAVMRSAKAVRFRNTDERFAHALKDDLTLPRAAGALAT
jgi:hypothetical protein